MVAKISLYSLGFRLSCCNQQASNRGRFRHFHNTFSLCPDQRIQADTFRRLSRYSLLNQYHAAQAMILSVRNPQHFQRTVSVYHPRAFHLYIRLFEESRPHHSSKFYYFLDIRSINY